MARTWGVEGPRLNEGLPQKGKRSGGPGDAADGAPASMKGFPRRGSDRMVGMPAQTAASLNEGLPQKGKRFFPSDTAEHTLVLPQ